MAFQRICRRHKRVFGWLLTTFALTCCMYIYWYGYSTDTDARDLKYLDKGHRDNMLWEYDKGNHGKPALNNDNTDLVAMIYRTTVIKNISRHIDRRVIDVGERDVKSFGWKDNLTFDDYFKQLDMKIKKKFSVVGSRSSPDNHAMDYSKMSYYWKRVDDAIGKDGKLYQNDFNVDELLVKMKTDKIINVTMLRNSPTFKWLLTLDGGQKVLFKPDLNTTNERCQSGCEHPVFEVTGFAINRMLGLNTMPFTTDRTINWFKEIEPISSTGFKKYFKVFRNSSVPKSDTKICINWKCVYQHTSLYCFNKGQISGSIIYWTNRDILELRQYSPFLNKYTRFHPMHFKSYKAKNKVHALQTGDSRFCDKFRQKPPYDDMSNFLYVLDMSVEDFLTQSKNSKHSILYLDSSSNASMNVVIDKGKGFCRHENDLLLAPIYQCCKIRRSTYEALLRINGTFVDNFMKITYLEPDISLVNQTQLDDIEARVNVLLKYVDTCFAMKGRERVLV